MKLTNDIWFKAVNIFREVQRKNQTLGRHKLKELLGVSEQKARQILFALYNQDIIKNQPQEFEPMERVLILCDIHIPYHDKSAIEVALDFAKKYQPDIIVLLGDVLDCYSISVYSKNPKKPRIEEEIKIGKEFLSYLRDLFPKARMLYKEANHSYRLQQYIFNKAPDLAGILDNLLPNLLGLDKLGIQYIIDPFKIGKLYFIHGHELRIRSSVEYICSAVFRRTLANTIVGHWHTQQEKMFKQINGEYFWVGAVGCLCKLVQDYTKINNWCHGFAYIEFDNNGNFKPSLKRIINGRIY